MDANQLLLQGGVIGAVIGSMLAGVIHYHHRRAEARKLRAKRLQVRSEFRAARILHAMSTHGYDDLVDRLDESFRIAAAAEAVFGKGIGLEVQEYLMNSNLLSNKERDNSGIDVSAHDEHGSAIITQMTKMIGD